MKVRDIMTRDAVSCEKETDIGTAARLMLEGRFGTLPVVDAPGRLVGIITDRDIAMAAAARQRNASHIAAHEADEPERPSSRTSTSPTRSSAGRGRIGGIASAECDGFPAFETEFPASEGSGQADPDQHS